MSLKTRIFGKKIRDEELTNLMDILGIERSILNNASPKMTTEKSWGRCSITPEKDGLNVNLCLYRKDFHILESGDLENWGSKNSGDVEYSTSRYDYNEKITYNKISK